MTILLGKPLTFGDSEQIREIKRIGKEAERQQKIKDHKCLDCAGTGEAEEECDQCEGTGTMNTDCSECDGNGYIEPEENLGG